MFTPSSGPFYAERSAKLTGMQKQQSLTFQFKEKKAPKKGRGPELLKRTSW